MAACDIPALMIMALSALNPKSLENPAVDLLTSNIAFLRKVAVLLNCVNSIAALAIFCKSGTSVPI